MEAMESSPTLFPHAVAVAIVASAMLFVPAPWSSAARESTDDACRVCHGDPAISTEDPSLYVPVTVVVGSVHGRLSCVGCHGPLAAQLHAHPEAELAEVRASCAGCHGAEAADFEESVHGTASQPPLFLGQLPRSEGRPPATPTCVACHGAHDVQAASERSFAAGAAERCSACHGERGESFFDRDYHGKETRLGRRDVAVCSDCHGGHLVLPANDPRSSVHRANVVTTCRGCHENAPENFRDVVIHVGGWPLPSDPKLRAVTLWMTLMLVGTFGFFGIHTALAIRHSWRERHSVGGESA